MKVWLSKKINTIANTERSTSYWVGISGGLAALVMTVIVTIGVVMRYVFNSPLRWDMEVAEYLLVACAFLGAAYTDSTGGHVNITFFVKRMAKPKEALLEIIIRIIVFIVMAISTWRLTVFAIIAFQVHECNIAPGETPVGPAKAIAAFGALLLCIEIIARIQESISKYRRVRAS